MRTTSFIILIFISCCAGVTFVALQYQWVIVHYAGVQQHPLSLSKECFSLRQVSYMYHKRQESCTYKKDITWEKDAQRSMMRLVNAYFELLEDQGVIDVPLTVQTASFNVHETELFLSYSQSPFAMRHTVYERYVIIQDLLDVMKQYFPQLRLVYFLSNHEPLDDPFLEFRIPWPIQGFSYHPAVLSGHHHAPLTRRALVVLHPSGDSQHVGRTIDEAFERTITFHIAQALKVSLEKSHQDISVVISRSIGDILSPLQNASYINRLHPDICIHLGAYQSPQLIPELTVYTFCTDPITDTWKKEVDFVSLYSAHKAHAGQSKAFAQHMVAVLRAQSNATLHVADSSLGIPFRPLAGIAVPALACEIGISHHTEWESVIKPMTDAILDALKYKI